MGTYAEKVKASNRDMTDEQVRAAKNQRAHERNVARQQTRRETAEERQKARSKLSVAEQLKRLDRRPGQSKRERTRLTPKAIEFDTDAGTARVIER